MEMALKQPAKTREAGTYSMVAPLQIIVFRRKRIFFPLIFLPGHWSPWYCRNAGLNTFHSGLHAARHPDSSTSGHHGEKVIDFCCAITTFWWLRAYSRSHLFRHRYSGCCYSFLQRVGGLFLLADGELCRRALGGKQRTFGSSPILGFVLAPLIFAVAMVTPAAYGCHRELWAGTTTP